MLLVCFAQGKILRFSLLKVVSITNFFLSNISSNVECGLCANRRFHRRASIYACRLIIYGTTVFSHLHCSVSLAVVDLHCGFVYFDLQVVWSQPVTLSIRIRECSALEQLVS